MCYYCIIFFCDTTITKNKKTIKKNYKNNINLYKCYLLYNNSNRKVCILKIYFF